MSAMHKPKYAGIGIPTEMNPHVKHLAKHLKYLPDTLPLNPPESHYNFGLTLPMLRTKGCMRKNWEINLCEQGDRVEAIVPFIKKVICEDLGSRDMVCSAWVERLICVVKAPGAQIPQKTEKQAVPLPSTGNQSLLPQPLLLTQNNPRPKPRQALVVISLDSDSDSVVEVTGKTQRVDDGGELQLQDAEEAQKQTKHKFAVLCETHDIRQEKMKERKERKRLKKLEINHEHQCQFQERKKMTPRNAPKVAMLGVDPGHGDMIKDFAALSQAGKKLQWRESQNGKLNGVVRTHAKQTNWYHPYLWAAISLGWSENMVKNVEHHLALHGMGRVGFLTPYPEMVEEITKELLEICTLGIEVSQLLGQSVMMAIIQTCQPDLLQKFKVLEFYVGQFFETVMKWSVQAGTKAAVQILDDWKILYECILHPIVYLVKEYDIPAWLVINFDQMGLLLLTSKNKTYDQQGAKDVKIAGKGEKQAYRLCIASTPAGDFLPFQLVWAGKTSRSLPKGPEVA
ncbi:hypothetical protein L208DRAFT_1381416 [Tricholoma matsutake]|nr:hypothetical protein L208DRAFT_1381416 [Tricholoma matsutake 945]